MKTLKVYWIKLIGKKVLKLNQKYPQRTQLDEYIVHDDINVPSIMVYNSLSKRCLDITFINL